MARQYAQSTKKKERLSLYFKKTGVVLYKDHGRPTAQD